MTHETTARSLLETLNAYVSQFGQPKSLEEMTAITGSIVTLQQKQGKLAVAPEKMEDLIQQVVGQFGPARSVTSLVDSQTATLIQQVHQWRESLERQVLNTLNTYVQQFLPTQVTLNLQETILSIIPMVEDNKVSQAEAKSLVQRITSNFSWEAALVQVIEPEPLAIAQKLAALLQHRNLETVLKETVVAYLQGFESSLETVTESLVSTALSTILGNASQVSLDTDISLEHQHLLIKQVSLKLTLMQASPQPSKTAKEIAAQMQQEIDRFKAERQKKLGAASLMQPKILGDLEVGVPIKQADSGSGNK
jgi:hypothetical protein